MASSGHSNTEFDYIVCGGGTSGCAVAARLAEDPSVSVLLLEAGGPKESVPASAIPAALGQVLGTSADWQIKSQPCPELNNRRLSLSRGKFIGGSSGCNGTLCIRGSHADYDEWGIEGWSGKEVFSYMSKAESFRNKDWFQAVDDGHGHNGPIVTAPHDPAPISDRILESFHDKGLSLVPDLFTTGESATGAYHTVRTISQGVRSTAADYLKGQDNLTIETNFYVDKVLLDASNSQATGVSVQTEGGVQRTYTVTKEIILSAGAYGSPAILLRSGIGPASSLSDLSIPLTVDLPGVGQNLQDHMVMLIWYEVSPPGITTDHLIYPPGAQESSLQQYASSHMGFMSQFPFGTFAFSRLDSLVADVPIWKNAACEPGRDPLGTLPSQPHVEFWNTECYSPTHGYEDFPGEGESAFAMLVEFFSARSRGQVTIDTKDPKGNPVVDHRYLSDPLDMLVFSEACRLANEIVVEGKGTREVVRGAWPRGKRHHEYGTREEWEGEIRERGHTCYHPAGTCKMGLPDDPMAVVDSELKVKGVKGLRVADVSIMPRLMSGHPQMACYAIGEKAADLIKGVKRSEA